MRGIERTFAQRRNRDAVPRLGLRRKSFGFRNGNRYNLLSGQCCDFACQPEMTEQIASVWRDFDIEDRVGWKYLSNWRADSRLGRQNQEADCVFADAQFFCTAKHPFAINAAQFALPNPQSAGQFRPRQRERNLIADLVIFCAANDLSGSTAPVVNDTDGEAIGIWMLLRLLYLRDNDLIEIC